MEQEMTFETEMDQFFARNCYSEKERGRVKAWPPYQLAAQKNDTIEAQEIATQVLEKKIGISEE
jgi:CRISPR/Cas system Type II protein with McrA/HNH and RuvC-like nuclease domain